MSDDLRFDQMLTEDAAALPPPGVEVNPWREAMCLVLWGLGLTTLTLHFLYLDVILPAVGAILMVLGFRTLRRENRALQWCYRLSVAAAAVRSIAYTLNALPWETGYVPAYVTILLTLALYVCLWRGMVGVSRAAGSEKPAAPAAGALVICYAVMIPLAYIGLEGWLAVLPLVIIYIVILRNLMKLSRSLADTGYVVTAAPVRLPSWAVLWGYLGVTLAAILLAMFLGQRYPMDWQPRADAPQDAAIRAELLELGFPRDVLDDLTANEVAQMAGAETVIADTQYLYDTMQYRTVITDKWNQEHNACWQYVSSEKQPDGSYRYTFHVYDNYQRTLTSVAVGLPEEGGCQRWLILHALHCDMPPERRYTECLRVFQPVWVSEGWEKGDLISGRVLCHRRGQPVTADFRQLGITSASGGVWDFLWMGQTREQITAVWSWPASGTELRAYVLYDALLPPQTRERSIVSWVDVLRQRVPTYPFTGADEMSNGWYSDKRERHQAWLEEPLPPATAE